VVTSEQPHGVRVIFGLAAFALVVAGVSWLVTGKVGRVDPVPAGVSPETGSRSVVQECGGGRLQLLGAISDCVSVEAATHPCAVEGSTFAALFNLNGDGTSYRLFINVLSGYHGNGEYGLNGPAGVYIFVRDYRTGALWQSVRGTLELTGGDFTSGTLNANLGLGGNSLPTVPLSLAGAWHCK
jgi:hypothetical protein